MGVCTRNMSSYENTNKITLLDQVDISHYSTNVSLSYAKLNFSGEIYVRLTENKILILNCYGSILYFHKGRNTHTDKCFVGL